MQYPKVLAKMSSGYIHIDASRTYRPKRPCVVVNSLDRLEHSAHANAPLCEITISLDDELGLEGGTCLPLPGTCSLIGLLESTCSNQSIRARD